MSGALRLRAAKATRCRCGKQGWPTRHDADQVVVNAKILRHLHGRNKRLEQRSYRCSSSTMWHVTSQDERAYGATYQPDDDTAACEYIESLLLADAHPNSDEAWERLCTPLYAAQTNAVLSRIHQAGLKDGADRKAIRRDLNLRTWAGEDVQHRLDIEDNEHAAWIVAWTRFQAVLVARKAQTQRALRDINIAASSDKNAREAVITRNAVRQLGLAIRNHQTATPEPTKADRALWAVLATVYVPYGGEGERSVQDMFDTTSWTDGWVPR